MIFYPHAKINIGLEVVNRRSDGFHNIQTLFYPLSKVEVLSFEEFPAERSENSDSIASEPKFNASAACYDILEIVPSSELRMNLYGITYPGEPMDNICVKAWQLLKEDYPQLPPVEISLYKKVPVGAGLGGGSSDGARVLTALNDIFSLAMDSQTLASYAARLGSDCAFFIYDRPMIGSGRGEILSDFPLDLDAMGYCLKLVHPPFFISTKDAYGGIVPRDRWPLCTAESVIGERTELGREADSAYQRPSLEELRNKSLEERLLAGVETWKDTIVNDFETTVFAKYPQLASFKQMLYDQGAVYAAMSGSGSTMFGIFRK